MTNATRDASPLPETLLRPHRDPGQPLAVPVPFALGWCASTNIGVDVDDEFTVFGAAGAVLFTLLSGLLLARFTPTRTRVA